MVVVLFGLRVVVAVLWALLLEELLLAEPLFCWVELLRVAVVLLLAEPLLRVAEVLFC